MGSVKDLTVLKKPIRTREQSELGIGIFEFSDRYSVFDWGEMPDHIPGKGRALALMAAHSFEKLRGEGIDSHYIGLMDASGRIRTLDVLRGSSNRMVVYLVDVIRPDPIKEGDRIVCYDYTQFIENRGRLDNFLIPLEIIYRNGAPLGSSMFKKVKAAQEKGDQEYINGILQKTGLKHISQLVPGVKFPTPTYDFSTKLEETGDRALSDEEAFEISGLTHEEFVKMLNARNTARAKVGALCEKAGFEDYDGKVEFVYSGKPILADVLGTFDENRFMVDGIQISKEVVRQWYKKNQPEWVEAVEEAKETKREDWKLLCKIKPVSLPQDVINFLGDMYMTGAQCYVQKNFFGMERYNLEDMARRLKHFNETGEVLPKEYKSTGGGENA